MKEKPVITSIDPTKISLPTLKLRATGMNSLENRFKT